MLVAQSCLTLCDPMDCSPPGFSVHGILQAGILEWRAIPFSRGFSQPRDQTWVSHSAGRFFTAWAARETHVIDIVQCLYMWRRQWHPTPVLLLGKSHWRRSLVGYSPWGRKESDMTEWLKWTKLPLITKWMIKMHSVIWINHLIKVYWKLLCTRLLSRHLGNRN